MKTTDSNERMLVPKMLVIPSGIMPATSAALYRADYSGEHVDSFELGQFVVTIGEWCSIMADTPSDTDDLFLDHPVININWYDAHRYIKQLNKKTGEQYRLPSELEWEYAARAGYSGTKFHSSVVNFDKKKNGPIRVGGLKANPWGLSEMLGNVWEWVSDGGHTVPGIGDSKSYKLKVLRGGCWASRSSDVTLTARAEHKKDASGWNTFGFRIAKSVL